MSNDLEVMVNDVVKIGNPQSPEVLGDGQTLMVITNTLSIEEFSKLFTTIRISPYGFIQIPYELNEQIQITRDLLLYLDTYTTGDKKKLIECADPNNSDMTKLIRAALTNDLPTVNSFSRSEPYRLRYPCHAKAGIQFIEALFITNYDYLRKFNNLLEKADETEKYRLYDLENEPRINNLSEALNKQAAEFAINQHPESLVQFVECYQFYKSWALNIRDDISKKIRGTVDDKDYRSELSNQTLMHINDAGAIVVKLLIDSTKVAEQIGVGPYNGIHHENIKAFAAHLKFKSKTSLAYHVRKHFKELPGHIKNQSLQNPGLDIANELQEIYRQTFLYLKTAREVIEKYDQMEIRPCQFHTNGSVLKFTTDLCGSKMQTFVQIVDGQAVITTCFKVPNT